ncbi:probable pectate lyase 5 [Impatiens glandulifera]|uniref:probable pectate lyase 5 n=1 Tax=Impatiens glandulifera TaxID=253017 RepID=UPI001FB115B8|nr:probable pectate lyase 5 [Impatiens glandulifera]
MKIMKMIVLLHQRSLLFLLPIFFVASFTIPSSSISLPHQHPHPESIVQELHRRVNESFSRRQTLETNCLTGNPIDDCWRCDLNWFRNRQKLSECGIGFGQSAIGGKNGKFYVVSDSSDNDPKNPTPGTIRHAVVQTEPLWIIFSSNMHIKLKKELVFNSYKTVDGRGAEVLITGAGCLMLQGVNNIIIHGIEIRDCVQSGNAMISVGPSHAEHKSKCDGDGIHVHSSSNIWIDHCTLSNCVDGLIDVTEGSTAVTISNNYFSNHDKVMLLGHNDDYSPDSGMQVTVAFNHFGPKLVQRMPRCRLGYFHVVNNDYTEWELYAVGGSGNPTINSQGNRYAANNNKEVTKRLDTSEKEWKNWNWRSEGDIMVNGAFFVASGSGLSTEYAKAYSLNPNSASLIEALTANVGATALNIPKDSTNEVQPLNPGSSGDNNNDIYPFDIPFTSVAVAVVVSLELGIFLTCLQIVFIF